MKKSDVLGYCAIDCEMVETIDCQNALARVSIIDEQCNILLDQYVIPPGGEVVTYRTRFSGITEKIIRLHGIPFKKVQERVQSITDRYRIVGHTIKNDLETLQLRPKNPVIDIVDIEELRTKFEAVMEYDTGKEKIGLKRLSAALLMRMIQESDSGHSSVEDAIATMELFKLVQTEWERRCPDLAGADLMDDQFWPEDSTDAESEDEDGDLIRKSLEEYSEEYI